MTYSVSSAGDLAAVCGQIAAFAVANAGFANHGTITIDGFVVQRLSKNGTYFYFGKHATGNYIKYRLGLTLLPDAWPTDLNGQQYDSFMSAQAFPGPYPNVHFYGDGTAAHMCIELSNGIFNHLSLGSITKTDTFTGGEYMTAGNYSYNMGPPNGYGDMLSPGAGNSPFFLGAGYGSSGISGYMRRPLTPVRNDYRDFASFGDPQEMQQGVAGAISNGLNMSLLRDSPNTGTQRSVMFNNYITLYDHVSDTWRLAGYIPNMRAINMRSLDLGEMVYEDWQVWPLAQRNGDSQNTVNSIEYGVAYQK